MKTKEKKQTKQKKAGEGHYLNKKCWLVKNLNYPPYRRCQYCELKFYDCLFMRYQVISLVLGCFSFLLIYLFEKTVPAPVIIIVFTMVIVYGYYFNGSTEKIVKANFLEKKAKNDLKKFSKKLEERVEEQTRDITKKNQHLEELLNMKSEFLRTVNHQLNTPLSIMRNAFAMMEDKSLPVDRGMEIAANGLERMSRTIADFWDAFELEGQKISVEPSATDIGRIINDMVKEKKTMKLVLDRNLKIEVIKPDFFVPKVLCDQKMITHVVSNLLDNAVYYTSKGIIKVWFEIIKQGKKQYLKIFISDSGAGISEEDQKRLFIKFSRGSIASTIHPDGSGLGLYIAKNIIENSGGELRLEKSEVGKGTTFSFTLEKAKPEKVGKSSGIKTHVATDNRKVGKEKTSKTYSVLMVEDEQDIVDLYKIYFEKFGHTFYSTYDLPEAKNLLKNGGIDVVALDVILKKKEKDGMVNVVAEQGYEFLKEIKGDKDIQDIPVIMFTNLNTEKDRIKAKELGASDYLFKGIAKPRDLLDTIDRVVAKK